jgi:hypothetical protein
MVENTFSQRSLPIPLPPRLTLWPAIGLQERRIIRVVEADAVILNDEPSYVAFLDGEILPQHGDLD